MKSSLEGEDIQEDNLRFTEYADHINEYIDVCIKW